MGKGDGAMLYRYTMPPTSAEHTGSQIVNANLIGFQVKLPVTVDACLYKALGSVSNTFPRET